MKQLTIVVILLISVLSTACSTTSNIPKSEAFERFYDEKPSTVLIAPPINKIEREGSDLDDRFYFPVNFIDINTHNSSIPISNSQKMIADKYFYSSLSTPFSKKGFSVIARDRTEEILKAENALNSSSVLDSSIVNLREEHGVDMVVLTFIHEWEHNWRQATMDISVEYIIKSTLSDEIIYSKKGTIKYDLAPSPESRILASTEYNLYEGSTVYSFNPSEEKYLEVARISNLYALNDLPFGRDHENFGKDRDKLAGKNEFKFFLNEYSE